MEEHVLNQSAPSRALQDTIKAQRTLRFMWGGEGVFAIAGGAWLSAIAPESASTTEQVVRAIIGVLIGLGIAVIFILICNLFRAPYKQRNEARKQYISKKVELDGIINARPRITVTPIIYYSDKAELEVYNDGAWAIFTATARVVKGITERNLFNLHWKSHPNDASCPINSGETKAILIAEISPSSEQNDNIRTAVFKNGIALYKMGGGRIGTSDYQTIEDAKWKERYPEMFQNAPDLVDECEIEVTITSEPQLSKPFDGQRYLIKIDHQRNGLLEITPVSNPDK